MSIEEHYDWDMSYLRNMSCVGDISSHLEQLVCRMAMEPQHLGFEANWMPAAAIAVNSVVLGGIPCLA